MTVQRVPGSGGGLFEVNGAADAEPADTARDPAPAGAEARTPHEWPETPWDLRVKAVGEALAKLFGAETAGEMVQARYFGKFANLVGEAAESAGRPVVEVIEALGRVEDYYVPLWQFGEGDRAYAVGASFSVTRLEIRWRREACEAEQSRG